MAKKEYFTRFLLLIKRIKKNDYPSFEQLFDYVQRESEFLDDEDFYFGFSKRTLQRDIREIRTIFAIDINYSRKRKGYFIDSEISKNYNFNQMLETYDVLQLFKTKEQTKDFLFFEQKKPKGTEYFNGILHAIKHCKKISFDYEKYWDATITKRTVSPLGLKENDNRWYVIAKNENNELRSFALDRFSSFTVLEKSFVYPLDLNIENLYQFNYGVSIDINLEPKNVIFVTNEFQAKYFKSLPLHHTQQIETEKENEVKFSINVKLSDELVYKFLSFGDRVKVIHPPELIDEIYYLIKQMRRMYD